MIFLVKTVGIVIFIVSISILAAVFLGIILKLNNLVFRSVFIFASRAGLCC